ncbi:MAG: sugar ABC transporter ATP-binding protein [Ruthenibacterium sp.]
MEPEYKLQLKNITKRFPGVCALDNVSLNVRKGTVHSIVGENGAGKSTLMKVLNGSIRPDEGEIWIDGNAVAIRAPKDAYELGVAMIWQELQFLPHLTIEENLVINKQPFIKGTPFIDWKKVNQDARKILAEEGITHDPKMMLSDIQLLEIIKATNADAQIIIMDEPTSSLTQHETERLFEKIKRMRAEGRTILYISHKMDEIFQLSDDVTIMRDGKFVGTYPVSKVNRDDIISMMVGRKVDSIYPMRSGEIGKVIFETKALSCGKLYQNINFNVRRGEIVGFAGLVGAGRTEIVRAISGLDPCDSGEVLLEGKSVNHKTVNAATTAGIMMATEDRRRYGLIPVRSIKENITLATLPKLCIGPFIRQAEEKRQAKVYFDRMRVKAPSLDTPTYTLSGGNQQKVVLAKWMMANPKLFIMDEPTRGIDVGAKYEIYNIMNELAQGGMSIIMISSELPELLGMCDRIYIVCEGKIAGEIARKDFTQERVMNYATGGK